jgi:hypothetical protein
MSRPPREQGARRALAVVERGWQAKEERRHEYNTQAASARAKLHQLLERRMQAS